MIRRLDQATHDWMLDVQEKLMILEQESQKEWTELIAQARQIESQTPYVLTRRKTLDQRCYFKATSEDIEPNEVDGGPGPYITKPPF
jgi:hypothetical protein